MDVLPSPGSTSGDEEYYYQTCESDITGISSRYSLLVDEGIQQRSPSLEIVRVDPAPRIPSEERLSIYSAHAPSSSAFRGEDLQGSDAASPRPWAGYASAGEQHGPGTREHPVHLDESDVDPHVGSEDEADDRDDSSWLASRESSRKRSLSGSDGELSPFLSKRTKGLRKYGSSRPKHRRFLSKSSTVKHKRPAGRKRPGRSAFPSSSTSCPLLPPAIVLSPRCPVGRSMKDIVNSISYTCREKRPRATNSREIVMKRKSGASIDKELNEERVEALKSLDFSQFCDAPSKGKSTKSIRYDKLAKVTSTLGIRGCPSKDSIFKKIRTSLIHHKLF